MNIEIILAVLIGIGTLIGLYHEWVNLKKRVRALEDAARLRMPHEAMEKIMHGMAALDALQREKKMESDFIENAQAWLTQAMSTGTKREK